MSKAEKILTKAQQSPQNVRFDELITLYEHFEFKLANTNGSHFVFSRKNDPKKRLSIQKGCEGKAKPYQVKQLLDWANENNLI